MTLVYHIAIMTPAGVEVTTPSTGDEPTIGIPRHYFAWGYVYDAAENTGTTFRRRYMILAPEGFSIVALFLLRRVYHLSFWPLTNSVSCLLDVTTQKLCNDNEKQFRTFLLCFNMTYRWHTFFLVSTNSFLKSWLMHLCAK